MTTTSTVIDIITYQQPPAGETQFIWTDNAETADQHYDRICREFPEYLVRQFRSGLDGDGLDLASQSPTAVDELIGFHLLADMSLGSFVRERPALIDGRRVIASAVSVTAAQYASLERLAPQGYNSSNRLVRPVDAEGNVSVALVEEERLVDLLIRPDGSYTEMTARIDRDAWQGTHKASPFICRECGLPMTTTDSGVTHHLNLDEQVDHDLDADHVATPELGA